MTNPFNEIASFQPNTIYWKKAKVIYNFQVYMSLINNNTLLPSSGNPDIDSLMSQKYGVTVGNTWTRI